MRRSSEDSHQSFRVWIGQRAKEERIKETEHRGVHADAQREREHGHGGKSRILQQLAESEFEVMLHAGFPETVAECPIEVTPTSLPRWTRSGAASDRSP